MNFSQLAVDMDGALCSHFPSQCCCARFGELAAINNIGRTKRRARSEKKKNKKQTKTKKSVGRKCPNCSSIRKYMEISLENLYLDIGLKPAAINILYLLDPMGIK